MFYIDGQFVSEESATIPLFDLLVLRGFGVFDYLRTYNKKPFHLWDHLLRLQYSAKQIELPLPHSLHELQHIIYELLSHSPHPEVGIKILLTGGPSQDHFTPQGQTRCIIFTQPLPLIPQNHYTQGIPVVTTTLMRSLPMSKTLHYTPAIVALQRAKAHQPKEVLYLNSHNDILEGATSNFFAFKQDTLFTCHSEEVLFGITREILLRIIAPYYPIVLQSIRYDELDTVDEAFLTSSNKEVMPIVQIDGHPIGKGTVGSKTKIVMEQFQAYTKQAAWQPLSMSRYTNHGQST